MMVIGFMCDFSSKIYSINDIQYWLILVSILHVIITYHICYSKIMNLMLLVNILVTGGANVSAILFDCNLLCCILAPSKLVFFSLITVSDFTNTFKMDLQIILKNFSPNFTCS